jgi:hypothetical protein
MFDAVGALGGVSASDCGAMGDAGESGEVGESATFCWVKDVAPHCGHFAACPSCW